MNENDVNWLLLQPDTLRIAYMFEFGEWIENRFVCQLPTKLKFLLNQLTWNLCSDHRICDFTRCKNVNVSKALGLFYGAWVFIIKKTILILKCENDR